MPPQVSKFNAIKIKTMAANNKTDSLLSEIVEAVADKSLFCTKEVLTSEEVTRYMGISKSYLYKLTMRKEIPHYKPMGKVCYFDRKELEQWLLRNRVATSEELDERADAYCRKGGVL